MLVVVENMSTNVNKYVCCVSGCTSNRRDDPSLHFFGLPKKNKVRSTSLRSSWIELLKIDEALSSVSQIFVCCKHFADSNFSTHSGHSSLGGRRTRLKATAIPSLFLPVDFTTSDELKTKRKSQQKQQVVKCNITQTEVQDTLTSHPFLDNDNTDLTEDVATPSSPLQDLEMYKKHSKDCESDEESFHLPLYDEDDQIFFDDECTNFEDSATVDQDNGKEVQNSKTVNCEITTVKAHDQLLSSGDDSSNKSLSVNTAVVHEDYVEKLIPPEDAEAKQVHNSEIMNFEIKSFKSPDQFGEEMNSSKKGQFLNAAAAIFSEEKENFHIETAKKRNFSGNDLDNFKAKKTCLSNSTTLNNHEFQFPLGGFIKHKKFTVKDIEQFCMQKICQVLFYNSDVGNANYALQKQEDLILALRKDINVLTNQIHNLKVMNKKTMELLQLNSVRLKSLKNPVKITRSVGLQVNLTVKELQERTKKCNKNTLSVDSNLKSIKTLSTATSNNEKASSSASLILLKALTNSEIFEEPDIVTKYLSNNVVEPEKAITMHATASTVIDLTE